MDASTSQQGQTSTAAPLIQSQEHWEEDGDVVIQAKTTLFRIRMSRLVNASPIFEDMFKIGSGQTHPEQETYQGLPLVTFYDEPQDLEYFLEALIRGCKLGKRMSFNNAQAGGILRISTKYVVDILTNQVKKALREEWPLALQDVDIRRFIDTQVWDTVGHGTRLYHGSQVIPLARQFHIPEILPFAFYWISRKQFSNHVEAAELSGLDSKDVARLFIGKIQIAEYMSTLKFFYKTLELPAIGLPEDLVDDGYPDSPEYCRANGECDLKKFAADFILPLIERRERDPLLGLKLIKERKGCRVNLCKGCVSRLEIIAQGKRERLWKHFTKIFDLPPLAEDLYDWVNHSVYVK